MSEHPAPADLSLTEKVLKIANLQADTALKQLPHGPEVQKVVITAMAAGGALVGATIALMKAFGT